MLDIGPAPPEGWKCARCGQDQGQKKIEAMATYDDDSPKVPICNKCIFAVFKDNEEW